LAPRCHLQGVYEQQMIVSPTHTSGASCPPFIIKIKSPLLLKNSLKMAPYCQNM